MANSNRIPIYFSLARVSKRLENMDVSKISTREDLTNMIAKKLSNPIFTKSGTWLFNEFLKQKSYRIVLKKLRDYGSKHASRIHSSKNLIFQHLKLLLRIAISYIGDTESEKSGSKSDSENTTNPIFHLC
ncbi:19200_t:CDS:2 [Rhizophagus irregularis]|nr:19200_t:CDS:2 [Rhizophagus irregularis]